MICMSRLLNVSLLVLTSMLSASCSEKNHEHSSIDMGSVKNGVYYNKYLELKLNVPENWVQHNSRQRDIIAKKESKIVAGDNHEMQKHLNESHIHKLSLFSWFQRPLKSKANGIFNANILGIAERIMPSSGVNTEDEYLTSIKNLMKRSVIKYIISDKFSTITLNSKPFRLLEVQATVAGQVIKQRYYTRIHKGFALTIISSWQTASQLNIIKQSLKVAP